jgi:hypothetical protein
MINPATGQAEIVPSDIGNLSADTYFWYLHALYGKDRIYGLADRTSRDYVIECRKTLTVDQFISEFNL